MFELEVELDIFSSLKRIFFSKTYSLKLNGSPTFLKICKFNFFNQHFTTFFFSCREKKDSEVQTLEESKETETDSIANLESENEELRDKLQKLKSHYMKLYDFAKKNNIELKPRNVPMGSIESA